MMSKFNIGDKVKVTGIDPFHHGKIGTIDRISQTAEAVRVEYINGGLSWFEDKDLSLFTPTAPEQGAGEVWGKPSKVRSDDLPCGEEIERLEAENKALRVAAIAARDWIDRFGADAPIIFGGEAELWQKLNDAIQGKTADALGKE